MRCKFWKPSCKRESLGCDRAIHLSPAPSVDIRPRSTCRLTPASSFMTAKDVESDLNPCRAIAAFSVPTGQFNAHRCKAVELVVRAENVRFGSSANGLGSRPHSGPLWCPLGGISPPFWSKALAEEEKRRVVCRYISGPTPSNRTLPLCCETLNQASVEFAESGPMSLWRILDQFLVWWWLAFIQPLRLSYRHGS